MHSTGRDMAVKGASEDRQRPGVADESDELVAVYRSSGQERDIVRPGMPSARGAGGA